MINRETIWTDSYINNYVSTGGMTVGVTTAILHYKAGKNSGNLSLVSEVSIKSYWDGSKFSSEVTMTAEQMEELADYLRAGALHVRQLQKMLDDDVAEAAAAARTAISEDKAAA